MKVLHQIGDRTNGGNFNSLEEILAYDGPISFDGVYMSVYENYPALFGKDITFFFCYQHLGKDNSFDVGQPLSQFCNWVQILEMVNYLDAKVGFHGQNHLRCPGLEYIASEIAAPWFLIQWLDERKLPKILAWPYGDVNDECAKIAEEMGYDEAWSVFPKGDDSSPFRKNRTSLNWDMYDAKGNNLGVQP